MIKTQVYLVCDCSGSMAGHLEQAMRTAVRNNLEILATSEGTSDQLFETRIVPFSERCKIGMPWSAGELVRRAPTLLAPINTHPPLGGRTALFDVVGRVLEEVAKDADVPALVIVYTDGEENASMVYNAPRLRAAVEMLQAAGNLTLTLAGPSSVGALMKRLGLEPENFRSWDGTEAELVQVQADTSRGLSTYSDERTKGVTRSSSFYADPSALTPAGIKGSTKLVTPVVKPVSKRMAGRAIADFFGKDFQKGAHFYELVKTEKIQDGKDLIIFIKDQGEYRLGSRAVRTLLGLPETGEIRVAPAAFSGNYIIFVQSDSVNRKVVEDQIMLTVEV